ncbi:MAG: helix-turn-helix domain-containing protein [Chitinispirillales bacterium]|jgi:hypothetical protein|nr:helix-turn-helix domain-containing protein [Chitinispirillales bacterium]
MYTHDHDTFRAILEDAQSGDSQALAQILREFDPLIKKYGYVGSTPDEDLLSELRQAALYCVRRFKCDESDSEEFFREAEEILRRRG